MADALAITALGITVCGGLVKALRSWKRFGKDIEEAEQKAQQLGELLEYLNSRLQEAVPGGANDLLNERIARCQACIKSLEEETAKLEALHIPNATKRKVSAGWQHVKYPVTKIHLGSILTSLSDLQNGLGLAIEVYSLDKIERIENRLQDASSPDGTWQSLKSTLDTFALNHMQSQRGLSSTLDTLAINHIKSQRALSGIQADQQRLPPLIHEGNNEMITALRNLQGHVTQIPDAVTGIVNNYLAQINNMALENKALAIQNLQLYRLLSTKAPSFQADLISHRSNAGLVLDQPSRKNSCRDKKRKNADTNYTYTFRIPWVSQLVALTFYSTRGAGGQSLDSLGVKLKLKGFVHLNSPVLKLINKENFELLHGHPRPWCTARAGISSLRSILKQLEKLFEEGIASPNDILIGWESGIFEFILLYLREICSKQPNSEEIYLCETMCDTVASLGIPMNEGGDGQGTPLYCLSSYGDSFLPLSLYEDPFHPLSPKISDLGLYYEGPRNSKWGSYHFPSPLYVNEDVAEDSGCGEVALAVISGNKERLKRCLSKGEPVNEQEQLWGITALHIACRRNRREGVEILLNAGADVNIPATKTGFAVPGSVLEYALRYSSSHVLSLILDKKPVMAMDGRSELSLLRFIDANEELEKVDVMVRELHDRRTELAHLAHKLDSDIKISDKVLDVEAWHIYQRLSRNFRISSYLRPSIGQASSVFSMPRLTPSVAESLWSYGFLDVDTEDHDGYTPILYSDLKPGMLSWFLGKGIQLEARPPLET